MKFSYKFSNLLGKIYRNGNVRFSPDGNMVISPIGNRLTIYDLKNNTSRTLPLESSFSYTCIASSPDGYQLLAINEIGEAQLISLRTYTVIHTHKFKHKIRLVEFSPNGLHFAIAKKNLVLIFKSPTEITGNFDRFILEKHLIAGYDDITWLDWSSDSRFLAVGCRDNSITVTAIKKFHNFRTYVLGGHVEPVVGCFFEPGCLNLKTLSRNGHLILWKCSLTYDNITLTAKEGNESKMKENDVKKKKTSLCQEINNLEEDNEERNNDKKFDDNEIKDENGKSLHQFYYIKLANHYLADEPRKKNRDVYVTVASYSQKANILVVAFSSGDFYLYELPEVNIIHSLSISNYPITSVCFNPSGDWLAMGSSSLGQLLVWEWQSEQYIMKQQGHSSEICCIAYSPDGNYIASGGHDHKVKLWKTTNGFCFVTFTEHTNRVTGVEFSKKKQFLVSSSLDGTVRAFDIKRYRNFRTFTSPRLVQFVCVAIDNCGELIAAGGQNVFEIYLWSFKLGKLLEILSGHQGPVTSMSFSPISTSSTLVSGSWDKTIKIWDCLENHSNHDTIDMFSDVTCVAFKPNAKEIAVGTLNGNITIFDAKTKAQVASIEGRNDLISTNKNEGTKCFKSIEYSADGDVILAAGKSKNVCIYHVTDGILLKKFTITLNRSFDCLNKSLNRNKMSELDNMAIIEKREDLEGGNELLMLPEEQKRDVTSRNFKPEINVHCVKFSPTGDSWCAACTEGLIIYSLDKDIVFDPFDFTIQVTPKATLENLTQNKYLKALIMAIRLNQQSLIISVIEKIPDCNVKLVSSSLPNKYASQTLQALTGLLRKSIHIEFYLKWICYLLTQHGNKDSVLRYHTLLALHESLSRRYDMLSKICDLNRYMLKNLSNIK